MFSQKKVAYLKSNVKPGVVMLRWVPSDKAIFELAQKNGFKLTRYIKANNTLVNPVILIQKQTAYLKQDTLKWARLIQQKPNGLVAYQALYNHATSSQTPVKDKLNQENLLYNLMLLSCDFDSEVAKACGLLYIDSTVSNSQEYLYKIEINNLPPTVKLLPATVELNTSVFSKDPVINNLTASVKNKVVQLKWNIVNLKSSFGGYDVERSEDSIHYTKINAAPVILLSSQFEKKKDFITYNDTVPNVNTTYYYRIIGINHFGENSLPSNSVTGIGYKELNSFPIIDSIRVIQNQHVFVRWTMQNQNENSLVKEYILYRAKQDKGNYSKLHSSKNADSYMDEKPASSNYYKIAAITFGNDTLFSYSQLALIIDTIPPVKPLGLKATTDKRGNVLVTWDKNPETDIQGYKVYKANALNEEFVQLNLEYVKTNEYNDKLNLRTLSKKIYYKVVAADNNFNNSVFSDYVEVVRPDTIKPVAPIITETKLSQTGIDVFWILSSSDDAQKYSLVRVNEKTQAEVRLKDWLAKDTILHFKDTSLQAGNGYRYALTVFDDSNNFSTSNKPYIKYETGFRKKLTDFKAVKDTVNRVIHLNWNYEDENIDRYVIFRSSKDVPLTIIETVSHPAKQYSDKYVFVGNIYEYRIKVVFKNGTEAIISETTKVIY